MVDAIVKDKTKVDRRDFLARMLTTLGVVLVIVLILQKRLDDLFPDKYYLEKVALYITLYFGSGYLYEALRRVKRNLGEGMGSDQTISGHSYRQTLNRTEPYD